MNALDGVGGSQSVGGHPALDLVNTVSWRNDPARITDRLADAGGVIQWSVDAGLASADQAARLRAQLARNPARGHRVLEECRSLRELAYRLLRPIAVGTAPAAADLRATRSAIVAALGRAELVSALPLRWEVELHDLEDVPTTGALVLWRLLQFEDPRRLRQCQDSGCGWLFLDRSKNGSRVWCSSADCGNRARARRHYQRQRPATAGAAGARPCIETSRVQA
jgi:predicted RNA-binding Zn ribbon-like protein